MLNTPVTLEEKEIDQQIEHKNSFAALPLNPLIIKAVLEAGYTSPTPVQAQVIPHFLAGRDLMVSSQTGSGKTAAFMLPALHKLLEPQAGAAADASNLDKFAKRNKGPLGPRMLVLSPTRELALQISQATEKYGRYCKKLNVVSVLGGTPYPVQNRMLSKPYEILVATPGRLIDQMQRGRIDFSRVEMLVLDEADRMLDMGFIEDVELISGAVPKTSQTLLFSATLDGRIAMIAKNLLKDPMRIETNNAQTRHTNIEQRVHYVDDLGHKNRLLDHLLRDESMNQAVVFTATKRHADLLADELNSKGHVAAALHGDMRQNARNQALGWMRSGRVRIMVATDVAARGIDVPGISHVINFDLPKQPEDYVHRIGRTGRAGSSGIAISLAAADDRMQLKRIERFTSQLINVSVVPGLEPKKIMRAEFSKAPAGRGGKPSGGFKKPGSGFGARTGGFGGGAGGGFAHKSSAPAQPWQNREGARDSGSRDGAAPVGEKFARDHFARDGAATPARPPKFGVHKATGKTEGFKSTGFKSAGAKTGGFAARTGDAPKPWQRKSGEGFKGART